MRFFLPAIPHRFNDLVFEHHAFHVRLTSQASAVAMLRLSVGLIG